MNEEEFVFIYPKRLVLINQKWCDFCIRPNNEYYIKELVYLFGYQFCKDCENICQQQIDTFCRYKKEYPTNKFIQDFDLSLKTFNVKRSSGVVENNWKIDHTQFIKVKNGDSVKKGAVLMVIEAMKMEYLIRAPYSGKIKKINFKENEQIEIGQVTLEISKKGG